MLTKKDASLFAEKISANKFFAGKTVEISYKEYQAIKTEDNTVKVGKFLSVDEIHSPFCFGETIDYMVHVIRCSPRSPSLPKEISNMSYHKFMNFSFFRRVENYDKRGLMTSLVLDTYSFKKVLFTFEYDAEERLVQWSCSMFDKIVHSRKFVYYEDGSLQRRVRDLCGDTEEWEYDKNGKPLQYIRNWEGNIKTIDGDSYDEEKSEPYIWGTVSYKSSEGKIERTTISEDGEKSVIIYKDIEYQKEPDDFLGSDKYDENVFSCTLYDKKGNEIQKYVRTYFENGSWETVYYRNGIPKHIIRKECNILKDLNYMYTEKFKQVVQYCKQNNLFVGYGNPNGKVLVIGKEAAHVAKEDLADHLEKKKEELLQSNVAQWEHILSTGEVPNYDGERPISDENPLYAYGNQFNKKDIRKEGKPYNGGTSDTYTKYEKLYEQLFLQGEKLKKINFQKEFFITELSDYPTKESYNDKEIEALRQQSIEERKPLFALPFFKDFPIVIVAAGDYPIKYKFDMQQTFDVQWEGKTIQVGKYWYNLHFSKDNKRILIHTRQLSNSFSGELIAAIASEAKKFL